jgi:hypothetical protein
MKIYHPRGHIPKYSAKPYKINVIERRASNKEVMRN